MGDRTATTRLAHGHDEQQVESAQLPKLELGAPDAWRAVALNFREAIVRRRLDVHAAYLASNVTRHVAARIEAVAHAAHSGAPRLVGERRELMMRLDAVLEIATRVDDAVCNALEGGGELGDLELVVLTRLLDTIDEELEHARERELDMAMREHWVDIGGSG